MPPRETSSTTNATNTTAVVTNYETEVQIADRTRSGHAMDHNGHAGKKKNQDSTPDYLQQKRKKKKGENKIIVLRATSNQILRML